MKQRCESNEFIVITDDMEMVARVLYQTEGEGKRARQWRDRKIECVRGRALRREGDGIDIEIDRWR